MTSVICMLPAFRPTFSHLFTTNVFLTGVFMQMGSNQQEDLQQYWEQVLQNDTRALQAMHQALYPALHHYAAKLLKDDTAADDAIQELFVKMWQQRHTIGQIQHVKGYLYTLLRRQLLNMLRSNKTHSFHVGQWGKLTPQLEFSPEEIHLHQDARHEQELAVSNALNQLPARQREVLYFRFYEALDYAQIASIMGINYQSAVNLSFKGMQHLKQWFAEHGHATRKKK